MSNIKRGIKFGASSALVFPLVTAINTYLHDEEIVLKPLLTGTIFAFVFFGIIGTLTDKIGADFGD